LQNGTIGLTPVFDFAPMLLHPDGIARRMRWLRDDGGAPRWSSVVVQCREATGLPLPGLPPALREMSAAIADLPAKSLSVAIDAELVTRLMPLIKDVAQQLRAI
jgi:serine/threonine-protein kinase HipA